MLKKFLLGLMCVGLMLAAVPQPANAAPPLFLFVATAITGGWAAATYEECKAEGIDFKECASKTWCEREGVPITQEVYNARFNQ